MLAVCLKKSKNIEFCEPTAQVWDKKGGMKVHFMCRPAAGLAFGLSDRGGVRGGGGAKNCYT